MNTQKHKNLPFHKMVFRLWALMMILVLLAVAFMWVAQVFLFNRNYVNAAIEEVKSHVETLEPQLVDLDLAENSEPLSLLSTAVNSKMLLVNSVGELITVYSMGHPQGGKKDSSKNSAKDPSVDKFLQIIQSSDVSSKMLNRESFTQTKSDSDSSTWIYLGIPVIYNGQDAYVVLFHSLADIHTMLDVNRQQLILLTVLLTLAASVLAALMSRRFTKPIFIIKDTVDNLTQGNLTAKPNLSRRDELGQLANSVKALGTELQRVDVLRREVIANVSHELRSPLALIGGYAEMVRDITWKNDRQRMEDLNLIVSESRRMTEMVNDILDYSQFQAGFLPLKKERYNLCEIVETETLNCKKAARENHVTLSLEGTRGDIPVQVDALKLSQVIRNLVYNAINHTQNGGTITVTVEAAETGSRVSVQNPGPEIPEEERKLIWERYQRSQHQGGRKQGTGIGLSIVSTILQAHGMPYGVDCHDGLTVFWFEAPAEF